MSPIRLGPERPRWRCPAKTENYRPDFSSEGEIVAAPAQKPDNTAVGIRCANYATLSIRKYWH
jgi:hypothetical protein